MHLITELDNVFKRVHNTNSTAHEPIDDIEPVKDTWFDKYILRWV